MKTVIQDHILSVANAMFKNREDWELVPDELKKKWFFIANRYFSKIYPEKAHFLNDKNIDEITAMNIWYGFMKKQPYPKLFWSKSEIDKKSSKKILLNEKDLLNLQSKLQISNSEMEILVKYHSDEVKEELKYLKSQKENE